MVSTEIAGRVPRGRPKTSGFRDLQKSLLFWTSRSFAPLSDENLRFSNHLTAEQFTYSYLGTFLHTRSLIQLVVISQKAIYP